jgi:hypothetical protein
MTGKTLPRENAPFRKVAIKNPIVILSEAKDLCILPTLRG